MSNLQLKLPFDPTGVATSNLVTNEIKAIKQNLILFDYGAFYKEGLIVKLCDSDGSNERVLTSQEYTCFEYQEDVGNKVAREAFAAVLVKIAHTKTHCSVTYQAVGGRDQVLNTKKYQDAFDNLHINAAGVDYSNIIGKPKEFNPKEHLTDASTIYGLDSARDELVRIEQAISNAPDHQELNNRQYETILNSNLLYYADYNRLHRDELNEVYANAGFVEDTLVQVNKISTQVNNNEAINDSNAELLQIKENTSAMYFEVFDALYMKTYCSLLKKKQNATLPLNDDSLDVYKTIGDLQAYYRLDMDSGYNVTNDNFILTDKSGNSIHAIGDVLQSPYITNTVYSVTGLKTGDSRKLTFPSGKPFIDSDTSVVCVLGTEIGSTSNIKQTLLRGNGYELVIDTQNEKALQLINTGSGEKLIDIKCSRFISDSKMLVAFSLHSIKHLSYAVNSHPKEAMDENRGFIVAPNVQDTIVFDECFVGSTDSSGSIISLAIFNKTLSKRHLEAIAYYWNVFQNVNVNSFGNAAFYDGLYDSSTDYLPATDFTATEQVIASNDSLNNWFVGDFALGDTDAVNYFYGKHYLVYRGSTRQDKIALRKEVTIDKCHTYRLMFDLAFSQMNPADISIKINGGLVSKTFSRLSSSLRLDCTIDINVEDTNNVVIDWINNNNQVQGNMFAITNLRLIQYPRV